MAPDQGTSSATPETIIETALDRFSRIGYAGTSMRDIARAVGIQPASIYSHYASKEEILWDIYTEAMRRLSEMQREAAEGVEGVVERIAAFVRTHAIFHARYYRHAHISNSQMVSLSPEHYKEASAWRAAYEQSFRAMIEEVGRDGRLAPVGAKFVSYAILQMGTAISTWYQPTGDVSIEEIGRAYEIMALRMLQLPDTPSQEHE